MNELIEHLAERATKEMDQEAFSEDMNIPAEWYHKFAELIVRECAEVIFKTPVEYIEIDAMHRIRDNVKSHFGVE